LQARFQYVSEALNWGFAQGKTMLFRRDIVDAAGGIRALAADTAEDAATTKLVRGAGLRVHLVDRPIEQPLGRRQLGEILARQLRWARLRRVSFPLLFLPELLMGSVLPSLALVLALADYGFTVSMAAVLLLLAIWLGAEAVLARAVGWHFTPRTAMALLVRDLLLPALWIAAWLGNDYVWRGNRVTAMPRQDWQLCPDIDESPLPELDG
jgi:ceramide glucosyltransferase